MPKPWEVSPEEAVEIGRRAKGRLGEADRVASQVFNKRLARPQSSIKFKRVDRGHEATPSRKTTPS